MAGTVQNQDLFVAVLEGVGLGDVGQRGAVFDVKALAGSDDAAAAAGDLGDHSGAEAVQDLVEGGTNSGERAEVSDHAVAQTNGLGALHGVAIGVEHRARGGGTVVGGVVLELLRRERGREIIEHVFARRHVDLQIVPVRRRDLVEAALHQRFRGRDDLNDRGVSVGEVDVERLDQGWDGHGGEQVHEEALFGAFKGAAGCRFGHTVLAAPGL